MVGTPIGKRKAVNQAIECLTSAQRRWLLRYLLEDPETWFEREELALYLHEGTSDLATVEIRLAHQHLPKLDDLGLVDYDHRSGAIRPTEAVEELEPLLEACEKFEEAYD